MKKEELILIGGGGHCKSVIDVIESTKKFNIIGILDKQDKIGEEVLGYQILGTDDEIANWINKGVKFVITIGQIKSAEVRKKIFNTIKDHGGELATIIASTAYLSRTAQIGKGSVIMHNTVVNADSVIGQNTIVNTGALIEHDVKIGDHCHVSTKAVINGEVSVDSECFIGSNSVIFNDKVIGYKSIVGAGTVVSNNLKSGSILRAVVSK